MTTPYPILCDTCHLPILHAKDGEIQATIGYTRLCIVHTTAECEIDFCGFTTSLAGVLASHSLPELEEALRPLPRRHTRALRQRLGFGRIGSVPAARCDSCGEIILHQGQLEIVTEKDKVAELRIIHWECEACDRRRERVPLKKLPRTVEGLVWLLPGATAAQISALAHRIGITHPFTEFVAELAQKAAQLRG
jgi:hypothetical protein